MKIKCLFLTVLLLAVASVGFAQSKPKVDTGELTIEAAMKSFISSIETKNTAVFLNFVSPAKGLTIMNTIEQGEAGNADKPMLDSKLEYKKLAADFKKKSAYYQDIFLPSPDSPNFHDGFAKRKEKWKLVKGGKFQIVDADTGKPSNAFYVKLEKEGTRWFVTEIGRMIS